MSLQLQATANRFHILAKNAVNGGGLELLNSKEEIASAIACATGSSVDEALKSLEQLAPIYWGCKDWFEAMHSEQVRQTSFRWKVRSLLHSACRPLH